MSKPIPFSHDAEWAIIGACLLDPSAMDRVTVEPEHMHGLQQRAIWTVMRELAADRQPLDPIVVAAKADQHKKGTVSASDLTDALINTASAANVEHYAEIVRSHALTRAVLDVLDWGGTEYRAGFAAGEELLNALYGKLASIQTGRTGEARSIGEVVRARAVELDEIVRARARGEHRDTGVTTGIPRLDGILSGGWQDVLQLVVGRPGMGKSAFFLAAADGASAADVPTHVISLEDTREAYADRALARTSRIELTKLRTARLGHDDWAPLRDGVTGLWARDRAWLYSDVHEIGSVYADDIVRWVRRSSRDTGTRLVIVDYANLVKTRTRHRDRRNELDEVIDTFANAARDDKVAWLVGAQLSRSVEARPDKRPTMRDIKESGQFEERAKAIVGLYRGSYYGDPVEGIDWRRDSKHDLDRCPSTEEWESRIDLLVMKNNHGPTGLVRCHWDGPRARIVADNQERMI